GCDDGDGEVMDGDGRRWWWRGGGAWYSGSNRSGGEEHIWTWPVNSPEKFSGGGGGGRK
ncbi:hypothetical protein Tco_0061607, partial [Tanacetum coccineum]